MRGIRFVAFLVGVLAVNAALAASASADFGVSTFDGENLDQSGQVMSQANGHPDVNVTKFELNTMIDPGPSPEAGHLVPEGGPVRKAVVELPAGMVGNPQAVPKCDLANFAANWGFPCPDESQVGVATIRLNLFGAYFDAKLNGAIYNLQPQPGEPALFGFYAAVNPVYLVPEVRADGDYGLNMVSRNIDEAATVLGIQVKFWGNPASHEHDMERGNGWIPGPCGDEGMRPCPSEAPEKAFLTNNPDCSHGAFTTNLDLESWAGATARSSFLSHDDEGNPLGVTGCDHVPFTPSMSAVSSSKRAGTPSGLDIDLRIPDDGLVEPGAIAQSELKKAVVRLPEGVTLNPSSAEGLAACTPTDYAREGVHTEPDAGCPNASRLGSVDIKTPLLEEDLKGSVYIAESDDPRTTVPGAENPFDSLMAIYMVARAPERGIVIKQAGKVELDHRTGQVVTVFESLPQLPFSDLKMHFRAGSRAPLVTPSSCGTYTMVAEMTPWSAEDASDVKTLTSNFVVSSGLEGGACPSTGAGFHPGFLGGSVNNAAGSYSPFTMRLTRRDGEQELSSFNAELPRGVLAKLKGVSECPSLAVAVAKAKTGQEEIETPSCPASSEIGMTEAGAGVGPVLTYVPGHLYLGGPFHGAPLSVIAITPAVAGPFDVGTVVVHQALRVDPVTAQATADGGSSDPIPHILKGIPLDLRDLRVHLNRDNFTTTPTSCDPTQVRASLFGSEGAVADLSTRYQASSCQSLGFKPKLALKLSGPTHRSAHPTLKAVLKARTGDADIGKAVVTLPKTEFLENAHIRTVCTRVQYAADNCPKGSIYGYAKAWSPLLDKPLQGPVYLRSSNHPLPDLVASLDGQIHIDVAGRIDSVHSRMRATFGSIPDAPVSRFVLQMQGGKKGLLVNNTELCKAKPRASAVFTGHNGKRSSSNPPVKTACGKHKK